MIEKINRLEYENAMKVNVIFCSALALIWLALGIGPLSFVWLIIAPVRIRGLRPGGHIRRRLARKYPWASDID